ncbi:MAG: hypothetical protein KBB55_02165 [Candidatus Buchananbacteria bacterium]|nr:hypothetical protein [Candidatus Buchananbacteria bacterium]
MKKNSLPHKAWVVTVDMGYGHQRAAYPLKQLAHGGIITANTYVGIPHADKSLWSTTRTAYEFISRFKKVPMIGEKVFKAFDRFQSIPDFYPRRNLSAATLQVTQTYNLFKTRQWGKHLIEKLAENPLPLVTTFFTTAFMAEYYEYPGEIYCIPTDTDISRAWVAPDPDRSRIIYCAPNRRVAERLKLYGVKPSRIFLVGFPLPEENVGPELATIKADLLKRMPQLDPGGIFQGQYQGLVNRHLGHKRSRTTRPLTITFAVGGAGAQRELGATIAKSLRRDLASGRARLELVAGVNHDVAQYYKKVIRSLRLSRHEGTNINILFEPTKDKYFKSFNRLLRRTDILWTKPSELSFYCALGIPIIMAPPIGSQEMFNRRWLQSIGAGIDQEDPRYTSEWLWDWLQSGWLAEAAMEGFIEAPKFGTYNIGQIVNHHYKAAKEIRSVLQY